MGILLISLFVFIILGFSWALSDDDIKEIKNRFINKQSGGGMVDVVVC
jgi:hypothetical protein